MSKARESIKEIFPFKVGTFQITELLVNITKHVLKPKHEVLTAEEKVKLLKEYNVVDSHSDAVAHYYEPVCLSLSTKSASHSAVFFSHNKSANSTFSHDFSAKRTGPGFRKGTVVKVTYDSELTGNHVTYRCIF